MEVELAERPIAGELIPGEVEDHSHGQIEDDRLVLRCLIERVAAERVEERQRLIDPRSSFGQRAWVLASVAAFVEDFLDLWLMGLSAQAARASYA